MNKNRISRQAPKSTSNSQPQFFIHSEIAIDERVRYIESVCATLIESRFGPDLIFEPLCPSPRVSKGDTLNVTIDKILRDASQIPQRSDIALTNARACAFGTQHAGRLPAVRQILRDALSSGRRL